MMLFFVFYSPDNSRYDKEFELLPIGEKRNKNDQVLLAPNYQVIPGTNGCFNIRLSSGFNFGLYFHHTTQCE